MKELAIIVDNQVMVFSNGLPKVWKPTRTPNLQVLDRKRLNQIGFWITDKPHKTKHQKYLPLEPNDFNGYKFVYRIVDMTSEEIVEYEKEKIDKADNLLDKDTVALSNAFKIESGVRLYDREKNRLERLYFNLTITKQQQISAWRFLKPLIYDLRDGDWELTKDLLDSQKGLSGRKLQIVTRLQGIVDNFISENYIVI